MLTLTLTLTLSHASVDKTVCHRSEGQLTQGHTSMEGGAGTQIWGLLESYFLKPLKIALTYRSQDLHILVIKIL